MRIVLGVLGTLAVLFLLWLWAMGTRRGERQMAVFRPWRYAHRGLHNIERKVPENSLLAFRYAIAGGFGAELDVRLTKDKRLAVIHDSYLDRLCGVHARVEEQTAAQLRELSLQGTGEKIPFLEEVLPLFEGKAPLIIELKAEQGNCRELCAQVCKALAAYRGNYCIESFDPRVLRWMKRNEPFVLRGQLAENFAKPGEAPGHSFPGRLALTMLLSNFLTRPDFIAMRFEDRGILPARLCCGLLRGQEVSWTIRSQEDLETAEGAGALVIFEGFLPKKRAEKPREEAKAASGDARPENPEKST